MAWLYVAAAVGVGAVALLHRAGITPFSIGYAIYTNSVAGSLIHNFQVGTSSTLAHRDGAVVDCGDYFVVVFGYLDDNFGYLVLDKTSGAIAVIDGADGKRAIAHLMLCQSLWKGENGDVSPSSTAGPLQGDENAFMLGWTQTQIHQLRSSLAETLSMPHLAVVLSTHRHMDHAGGNAYIQSVFPTVRVMVGCKEGSTAGDVSERIALGGTMLTLVAAPCHTRDSAIIIAQPMPHVGGGGPEASAIESLTPADAPSGTLSAFTGDTLFVGGVGKFFEGDAAQMHAILSHHAHDGDRPRPGPLCASSLPGHALVFPGHEYAVDNLSFAAWLDADNEEAFASLAWAESKGVNRQPAVPSTMDAERAHNPFLLAAGTSADAGAYSGGDTEGQAQIRHALGRVLKMSDSDAAAMTPVAMLAAIRTLKNSKAHKAAPASAGTGASGAAAAAASSASSSSKQQ